eukprot:4982905-Pleurochrysis_carterae.AAC.1
MRLILGQGRRCVLCTLILNYVQQQEMGRIHGTAISSTAEVRAISVPGHAQTRAHTKSKCMSRAGHRRAGRGVGCSPHEGVVASGTNHRVWALIWRRTKASYNRVSRQS